MYNNKKEHEIKKNYTKRIVSQWFRNVNVSRIRYTTLKLLYRKLNHSFWCNNVLFQGVRLRLSFIQFGRMGRLLLYFFKVDRYN